MENSVKAFANEIEQKEGKQNEGRKVKAHGSHPESPNRQMMRGEKAAAPGEEDEEDFKDTMDAISESANASADKFSLLPHGADVNAVATVGTIQKMMETMMTQMQTTKTEMKEEVRKEVKAQTKAVMKKIDDNDANIKKASEMASAAREGLAAVQAELKHLQQQQPRGPQSAGMPGSSRGGGGTPFRNDQLSEEVAKRTAVVRGFHRDTRCPKVEQAINKAFPEIQGKVSCSKVRSPVGHITFGTPEELKAFLDSEAELPKKLHEGKELGVSRYENVDDSIWKKPSRKLKRVLAEMMGSAEHIDTNHGQGAVFINDIRVSERKKRSEGSQFVILVDVIDSMKLGFSGADILAAHGKAME